MTDATETQDPEAIEDLFAAEAETEPQARTWTYLFAIALVMLAIGAILARGSTRDVFEQAEKVRQAQAKME